MIGRKARNVRPEEALEYVAGYAPANDVGLHDFRHADRRIDVLGIEPPRAVLQRRGGTIRGVPRRRRCRARRRSEDRP